MHSNYYAKAFISVTSNFLPLLLFYHSSRWPVESARPQRSECPITKLWLAQPVPQSNREFVLKPKNHHFQIPCMIFCWTVNQWDEARERRWLKTTMSSYFDFINFTVDGSRCWNNRFGTWIKVGTYLVLIMF